MNILSTVSLEMSSLRRCSIMFFFSVGHGYTVLHCQTKPINAQSDIVEFNSSRLYKKGIALEKGLLRSQLSLLLHSIPCFGQSSGRQCYGQQIHHDDNHVKSIQCKLEFSDLSISYLSSSFDFSSCVALLQLLLLPRFH
jgi:hypothetical protein